MFWSLAFFPWFPSRVWAGVAVLLPFTPFGSVLPLANQIRWGRGSLRERTTPTMKSVVLILACVVCNAVAQVALRQGASSQESNLAENVWSPAAWGSVLLSPPLILGIGLWTLSTLLWIYVLSGTGLSVAYGLYGLNYVLVPLLAHWRLAEPLSPLQILGMALIALGVGCTVAAGRGSS